MQKSIMVLSDGQSYAPLDGCRILVCPDNVTDQQIQQTLQQLNSGNLQALQNGYSVATRFVESQGQTGWQVQGQQAQNQPVALIEPGHFTVATRIDPSQLFQTQGSPSSQYAQQQGNQIQGSASQQSSQQQSKRPQW